MDEKKSFGEYIRRKRQEAGLTQRELAQQLFVTESTVSKWERGLSYPDVSLIPEVCRKLSISEHEFFTACDDDKAHAQEKAARMWHGLTRGWQWFFAISYAVAIVVCFICDLAIFGRLDWFWIVLTSVMLAFCFTNLPMLVNHNRLSICLGAATGCLVLLLLVCWLYTGIIWVLGGLGITAASLALPWGIWAIWRFHGRHVAALTLGLLTVWVFLLLAVIWLLTGGDWLLRLAFPIAAYCLLMVWVYVIAGHWLPVNGCLKAAVLTAFTAFLLPLSTAFASLLTDEPTTPTAADYFNWSKLISPVEFEWINILVFVVLLLAAAILFVLGGTRAARKKSLR